MRHLLSKHPVRCATFALAAICSAACVSTASVTPSDFQFDPAERYEQTDTRWTIGVNVLRRACDAMINRTDGYEYSAVWRIGSNQRYGESLGRPIEPDEILTGLDGAATIGCCFLLTYQYTGDGTYYDEVVLDLHDKTKTNAEVIAGLPSGTTDELFADGFLTAYRGDGALDFKAALALSNIHTK